MFVVSTNSHIGHASNTYVLFSIADLLVLYYWHVTIPGLNRCIFIFESIFSTRMPTRALLPEILRRTLFPNDALKREFRIKLIDFHQSYGTICFVTVLFDAIDIDHYRDDSKVIVLDEIINELGRFRSF